MANDNGITLANTSRSSVDKAASSRRTPRKAYDPFCRIIDRPIDVRELERRVSGIANGAVVTFIGQVRTQSRGREVAYLEYDAYVPMAEKMLRRIAQDAAERWGVQVAIEHRIGR